MCICARFEFNRHIRGEKCNNNNKRRKTKKKGSQQTGLPFNSHNDGPLHYLIFKWAGKKKRVVWKRKQPKLKCLKRKQQSQGKFILFCRFSEHIIHNNIIIWEYGKTVFYHMNKCAKYRLDEWRQVKQPSYNAFWMMSSFAGISILHLGFVAPVIAATTDTLCIYFKSVNSTFLDIFMRIYPRLNEQQSIQGLLGFLLPISHSPIPDSRSSSVRTICRHFIIPWAGAQEPNSSYSYTHTHKHREEHRNAALPHSHRLFGTQK